MRLVCLVVVFFHRQACLLGGQTTNRIFNYAADIPDWPYAMDSRNWLSPFIALRGVGNKLPPHVASE